MVKKKNEPVNSLAGWAEIIKKQGERFDHEMIEKQKAEAVQKELDVVATAELFHKLWGEAHDSPSYNKQNWIEMQKLLNKFGVPA